MFLEELLVRFGKMLFYSLALLFTPWPESLAANVIHEDIPVDAKLVPGQAQAPRQVQVFRAVHKRFVPPTDFLEGFTPHE